MTDDIYEHIRFDGDRAGLSGRDRARAQGADAAGQRRLQDLCDDRLPDRLRGRAESG